MEFVKVGESPPKGKARETKYKEFIEFVQKIKPGTGQGIVVAESEAKNFQMVALALSCDYGHGNYRQWRMKDRKVETRTERVEGGVRVDVYVTEVKDAKEGT